MGRNYEIEEIKMLVMKEVNFVSEAVEVLFLMLCGQVESGCLIILEPFYMSFYNFK